MMVSIREDGEEEAWRAYWWGRVCGWRVGLRRIGREGKEESGFRRSWRRGITLSAGGSVGEILIVR